MAIPRLIPAVLLVLMTASVSAQSADKGSKADGPQRAASSLDNLDCRTLLRLSGDERAFTLLYLHGFVSGRRNQLTLSTDSMAETTDRIVEHCIDKPGDKLLAVFEQLRPR